MMEIQKNQPQSMNSYKQLPAVGVPLVQPSMIDSQRKKEKFKIMEEN
jgi:hypothetical protein